MELTTDWLYFFEEKNSENFKFLFWAITFVYMRGLDYFVFTNRGQTGIWNIVPKIYKVMPVVELHRLIGEQSTPGSGVYNVVGSMQVRERGVGG